MANTACPSSDLPLQLERAIDAVEQLFRDGHGPLTAAAVLRDALLDTTGRASGAARLAEQMWHWHCAAPERAPRLSRAALSQAVAASLVVA